MALRNLATLALLAPILAAASVTVTSSANPSIFGQPVSFTATVSPPAATGSVTFYDGVAILGSQPLSNGRAVLTTTMLAAGSHAIRAYFAGTTSPPITTTVNAQPANGFLPRVDYALANSTDQGVSVVQADFNGDGKPDLAVTDTTGNVCILLGNGDGTFQPAVSYVIGGSYGQVAVGDFNGDGKPDLAVTNSTGSVSVFLGNGDGTFQPPVSYGIGFYYSASIVVADVNGDGNADLAILTTGVVLLGNSDGTFQPPVQWIPSSYSGVQAVGDFNNDGKIDFITFNGTVLLGNNDGTFQTAGSVGGLVEAVADFNGDGNADLAIVIDHAATSYYPPFYQIAVQLGNGDGTFGPPSLILTSFAGNYFLGAMAVGDFNGDGNLDLLVNGGVITGDGHGSFTPLPNDDYQGDGLASIAVGDFNGDGKTDFALANIDLAGVGVSLGSSSQPTSISLASSPNPSAYGQSVTLTATVSPPEATGTVSFYINGVTLGTSTLANGQAALTTAQLQPGGGTLTAAYGGDDNFLSSASPVLVQIVRVINTPTVTITASANPALISQPLSLTATVSNPSATGSIRFYDGNVEINAGILQDAAATVLEPPNSLSLGPHSLTAVYSGDTYDASVTSSILTLSVVTGTQETIAFTSSANPAICGQSVTVTANFTPPDATGSVTFYDGTTILGFSTLNRGQAILTTSLLAPGKRSLKVYYSGDTAHAPGPSPTFIQTVNALPTIGFQAPSNLAIPGPINSIFIADFNGDGKPDLLAADNTRVSIFPGNGDGTFQPPITTSVCNQGSNEFVVVGDFNGDGIPDLATDCATSPLHLEFPLSYTFSVWLGNGDGTFQAPLNTAMTGYLPTAAVADFNGDGKTDIVIVDSPLTVLHGNGDGTFHAVTVPQTSVPYPRIAIGDFNGDGNPDIAVANAAGDSATILLGPNFAQKASYKTGFNPFAVTTGDFNGDGITDLAVADGDGTVSVLLGVGDGTFHIPVGYPVGSSVLGIATADINGDGIPDLIATSAAGIVALFGNGDGTFQQPVYYGAGSSTVAVANFTGDGRTDLVTGNFGANSVSVLLADPTAK